MTTSTSIPDPSNPIVVTIALTASSPTLSLSASGETEPSHLITTATQTTSSPLTLHTGRFPASVTALATWPNGAPQYGEDKSSPALQGNAIRALVQIVDSDSDGNGDSRKPSSGTGSGTGNSVAQQQRRAKTTEWETFRVNWVLPPNMREDPAFTWATIPAAPGQLVVKHFLSRAKLMESGVRPGEVYETGLNARRSDACPVSFTYLGVLTDPSPIPPLPLVVPLPLSPPCVYSHLFFLKHTPLSMFVRVFFVGKGYGKLLN